MSESDAEMDSSLGILSPSDMKTSGLMSMTASQASNQGSYIFYLLNFKMTFLK